MEIDQELRRRLWEHALHEENAYNGRLNLFLVAEAMLLAFYAQLGRDFAKPSLIALGILGVLLTALWIAVNVRQEGDLKAAVKRLGEHLPEFHTEGSLRSIRSINSSDKTILTYCVPAIVALIWIVLLANSLT